MSTHFNVEKDERCEGMNEVLEADYGLELNGRIRNLWRLCKRKGRSIRFWFASLLSENILKCSKLNMCELSSLYL